MTNTNPITINQFKNSIPYTTLEKILNQTLNSLPEEERKKVEERRRWELEETMDYLISINLQIYTKLELIGALTGDILGEINLENYSGENFSNIPEEENVEAHFSGFHIPNNPEDDPDGSPEDEYSINVYPKHTGAYTFRKNGVRHHYGPSRWGTKITGYFVNGFGKVTDFFYGGGNDLCESILAYASKGIQFTIRILGDDGEYERIGEVMARYGGEKFELRQEKDGRWLPA